MPGDVPSEQADSLASLAAVTRAAAENAVAGTPSSVPAFPSVPAAAVTNAEFESQKATTPPET